MIWDNHCNTELVRWLLREHGVTLEGPDPARLVDPVSADQLRSEARTLMDEYADWAREPQTRPGVGVMSRWKQPYLVVSYCRMLHTLSVGRVSSKRAAGEWALGALDAEWASLIQGALDDRPDPWGRVHQPADPGDIERTLAFVDYAMTL